MTLMKDIEFMIVLFIPDPASSLSCERTLYCMYSSRLHAIVHYSSKDSKDKFILIVVSYFFIKDAKINLK